jgi:hypothetical protein
MSEPEFRLLPIESLHVHEEVDHGAVETLAQEIAREGVVREPIWVAKGTGVILNGHHRYYALRRLGARLVPAWILDYEDSRIRLERWSDGEPVTKADVLHRAAHGRPYPIKTTRHILHLTLRKQPTPLRELGPMSPTDVGSAAETSTARAR